MISAYIVFDYCAERNQILFKMSLTIHKLDSRLLYILYYVSMNLYIK